MTIAALPLTIENARDRFEIAASEAFTAPSLEGTGIVICAGGPFVSSAYVVVRLLRKFDVQLPIEIWHAGESEIPDWARRAYGPWDVTFHDVSGYYPERPVRELRGWPIKSAALTKSKFRNALFLDADCFPRRNLEFLFSSAEYKQLGALFWPDHKNHTMIEGAKIWHLTGLIYRGDTEFEAGLFALDKERCWRELCLVHWMNVHSRFWYDYVLGDKDTFYLAWRKLGTGYFLGPPCSRYRNVMTRHFWKDGTPLADHRAGTSKYALPRRRGPFHAYLTPAQHRSSIKNIHDELLQRFIVHDFDLHARYLRELAEVRDLYL
jgi:hypothetical protein